MGKYDDFCQRQDKQSYRHWCDSMTQRSDAAFFLLVILAIAGALYAPILGFGFNLATDDVLFVLQNPFIRDTSFKGLLAVVSSPGHVYGEIQPIPYLSFWTDYALFGTRATGYYLVQMMLHLLNVTLVFFLMRSLSQNQLIALVAALIFAIHPLQVDTVAMVNQRKTLLFSFFSLCSLLACFRWEESGAKTAYASSLIFFCLALLSKATAVIVPLLAIFTKFVRQGSLSQVRGIWLMVPFFLLALSAGVVTILTESAAEQVHSLKFGTLASQIKLVILIYGDYFWSVFLPLNLSPAYIYRPEDLNSLRMLSALMFCITAGGLFMLGLKKRYSWLTLGIGWFVICLMPTSQLIPTTNLRQDHYMYLALAGPALMVGGLVKTLSSGWEERRLFLPIIVLVTALLGLLTFSHLEHYSNGLKYCDRFQKTQGWIPALESLRGRVFMLIGEYELAKESYLKTIECFDEPLKSRERFQLAQVYLKMGQEARAREQIELISPLSPLKAEAERMFIELR